MMSRDVNTVITRGKAGAGRVWATSDPAEAGQVRREGEVRHDA